MRLILQAAIPLASLSLAVLALVQARRLNRRIDAIQAEDAKAKLKSIPFRSAR